MLEILIPQNNITLSFLKLDTKDKCKCIELGMRFLTIGTQTIQCWDNKQWEKKISRLQREIDNGNKKISDILSQHDEEKKLLAQQIRTTEQCKTQEEISRLSSKNSDLEQKINTMMESYINLHKQLTDEYDKKLSQRDANFEKKLANLQSRLDNAQKERAYHTKSTILGQDGESFTYENLNRRFPRAEIEDCHQTKGRGDFIMRENDFTMMIETKNYTKNVTKPEILKFYRDFDQNSDFKCAILVSLKSGICSRPDFHLEVRNNKPILFLHNVSKNMNNLALAVRFFKLILQTDHIDLSNKEIIGKLQILTPAIKRNWNAMRQLVEQFKLNITTCIEDQEKYITDIFKLLKL